MVQALHQFRIFAKVTGSMLTRSSHIGVRSSTFGVWHNYTQLYLTKGTNHPTIQLRANYEKRRRKIKKHRSFTIYAAVR